MSPRAAAGVVARVDSTACGDRIQVGQARGGASHPSSRIYSPKHRTRDELGLNPPNNSLPTGAAFGGRCCLVFLSRVIDSGPRPPPRNPCAR